MKQLKIPKHIEKKIQLMVRSQIRINKCINEINAWKPELEEVEIKPEGWTWEMFFTGATDVMSEENIIERLKDAWATIQRENIRNEITKK